MQQQLEEHPQQPPQQGSSSADTSRQLLSSIVATRTAADLAHLWRTAHAYAAPSTWAAAHLVAALLQLSELAADRQQGPGTALPEVRMTGMRSRYR